MGQNLVLNKIAKDTSLKGVLQRAFGKDESQKILALSCYSVCSAKALSRAEDWLEERGYGDLELNSQNISRLLDSLDEDRINTFFKDWMSRHPKDGSLLFDISSISSYAKANTYIERGYNRDRENLQQINLGLLSFLGKGVPLWYSPLLGSLSDSIVLDYVLQSLQKLGCEATTLVMDRGFYSEANIQSVVSKGQKFIIPVPSHLKWQKKLIDKSRLSIQRPANIIRNPEDDKRFIYGVTEYSMESYGIFLVNHMFY